MTPTSLGELRQRMAAICQDAKANNYTISEIIPPEMQDHFQPLSELKKAKAYINESEEREKAFLQEKQNLEKALKAEKKKVENLPDDHKQLQIDFQQLEKRVEFYRNLKDSAEKEEQKLVVKVNDLKAALEDEKKNVNKQKALELFSGQLETRAEFYKEQRDRAEERAEDYLQRWKNALQMQVKSEECAKQCDALQIECAKLVKENKVLREFFNGLSDETSKEKDLKIQAMEKHIAETEKESTGLEETYNGLIERLEHENGDVAAALNACTQRHRKTEQLKSAAVSEARVLCNYLRACSQAWSVCHGHINKLLAAPDPEKLPVTEEMWDALRGMAKEHEASDIIRKSLNMESLEEDEIREQLSQIMLVTKKFQGALENIVVDFDDFSDDTNAMMKSSDGPAGLWSSVKCKFKRPTKL